MKDNHPRIASSRNPQQKRLDVGDQGGRYSDWRQVAGFFDGDGLVKIDLGKFVSAIGLRWDDNYKPQVEQLASFLESKGVKHGRVTQAGGAWHVIVKGIPDVIEVSRKLVRYCSKKRNELRATLDYLKNRITGDRLVAIINEEVLKGNRLGGIREAKMPYTRSEAKKLLAVHRARNLRRSLALLSPEQAKEIRESHFVLGVRVKELAGRYGVSKATVERALYH